MSAQDAVSGYFEAAAGFWNDIYANQDVNSLVHQDRLRMVLAAVDRLSLPRDSAVLEVGCGTGHTTLALAERGFSVNAIDVAAAMVKAAQDRARHSRYAGRVHATLGDVHRLQFFPASFELVIAIGVLPWLPNATKPLQEIARVLKPGGCALVTMDCSWGLIRFADPATNPLVMPLKRWLARSLDGLGIRKDIARARGCTKRKFDRMLNIAGLEKIYGVTLGFGPFTLFGREFLSTRTGAAIHRWLQHLPGRGVPLIRGAGSQYLVLARRTR